MPSQAYIAEKIFAALIVLYLLFLLRYRWKIVTSRRYLRQYWRMQRRREALGQGLRRFGRRRLALYGAGLVVLVLAAYGAYARLHPDRRFDRLVDGCQQLIEEEKYEQAYIDMTNALRLRPDYVRGHYFIAALHRRQGETDKAEAALWRVVELDPGFESALAMLTGMLEGRRDAEALQRLAQLVRKKAPVESAVLEAEGLVMAGRAEAGRNVVAEALQTFPHDAGLHRLMGDILAGGGDVESAEAAYRRAVDADFGRWRAHFGLARIYLGQDRIEEALGELNFTRSLQPDFGLPAMMAAQIHFNRRHYDHAQKVLVDLLERQPEMEEARFYLGRVFMARKEFQDAVNSFERLTEVFRRREDAYPTIAAAYLESGHSERAHAFLNGIENETGLEESGLRLLARAALETGRGSKARKIISRLIEKGGGTAADQALLGQLESGKGQRRARRDDIRLAHDDLERLLAKRDYQGVIKGALRAMKTNPFKAPFNNLLGAAQMASGRIEAAKRHFRAAYMEDRKNVSPLLNWVNACVRTQDHEQAVRLLNDHNRKFKNHAHTRLHLGKLYLAIGKPDAAEAVLGQAIALAPKMAVAHQQLGVALRLQGRDKDALAAYSEALRLNPRDAISLNDTANILGDQGISLDRALAFALRADSLVPDNAAVLDTIGRLYLLTGQLEPALHSLRHARRLNPYLPDIPFHLAQVHQAAGSMEEAVKFAGLALSMPGNFDKAAEARRIIRQAGK